MQFEKIFLITKDDFIGFQRSHSNGCRKRRFSLLDFTASKTEEPEYYIQVLLFWRSSENLFLVGVDLQDICAVVIFNIVVEIDQFAILVDGYCRVDGFVYQHIFVIVFDD